MADDADDDISDDLFLPLQTSIDDLFSRIIDVYKSTFIIPKSDYFANRKKVKEVLEKMLTDLKEGYRKYIDSNSDKSFRSIWDRATLNTTFDKKNKQQVIDYVCGFVEHIEIKRLRSQQELDKIFSLTPHDCIGKIFSIDSKFYCPAQWFFYELFGTFIRRFYMSNGRVIDLQRSALPENSSLFKNSKKCDEYYEKLRQDRETQETLASLASLASQASQGGSKSRRIRRRKHRRKTPHKHARKTCDKRGRRRGRSYKKHTRKSKSHKRRK